MNFKYRKKVKQTLAAVLAAMLLTGCAKGLPMVSEVNETKAYTLPQSMIIESCRAQPLSYHYQ